MATLRILTRGRVLCALCAATLFGLLACLDRPSSPPLPVAPANAFAAQAAISRAQPLARVELPPAPVARSLRRPSLTAASTIASRSRLVPLLSGPAAADTGMEEGELASARELLEKLGRLRCQQIEDGDALGRGFIDALKTAYGVEDENELVGHVTAALITSTALDADTRYYYFGETPKMFPSASTIKTAIAARFFAEMEKRHDTGDFELGGRDYEASLRNMFGWSDNHSANVLQDRYGVDGMNSWLRGVGIAATDMKFRSPWVSSGPVPGGGNSCSAEGLAQLYFLLAQKHDVPEFLTSASLVQLRGLLDSRGSVNTDLGHNDRLNALFPNSVHFLHKTGSNRRMLGDAGIVVDGERSYVLVILDRTVTRTAIQRFGLATLLLMRQYDRHGWCDGGEPGLRYDVPLQPAGPQVLFASL